MLAPHRCHAQRLVGEPLASPAAVVAHFGAIQSQTPDMALWAIGRRCNQTLREVEAAFERGDFVRTHVLRPTWHDVLVADLPDLLEVTAPRIRRAISGIDHREGRTPDAVERWAGLAVDAVRDHGPLTRREVEQHLSSVGFVPEQNSMAHVMMTAELSGAIHSGPMRGKQHTYQLADLPASRRTPDERLAWIARTYARGHGPFRDRDLAWWTSLTLTQARRAIALAELEPVELCGQPHHRAEPLRTDDVPLALLLPGFDEFISYARDPDDLSGVSDPSRIVRAGGLLFVRGALSGFWTHTLTTSEVRITVTPSTTVSRAVRVAIEVEMERFGAFVNRSAVGEIHALG